MPIDLRDAFLRLSTIGKARIFARLIHAETVHARDAYTADYDAPDGIRLRERNETVHRLSGHLMALLGERVSAAHSDSIAGLIELIASSSPRRREELERWIMEAEA